MRQRIPLLLGGLLCVLALILLLVAPPNTDSDSLETVGDQRPDGARSGSEDRPQGLRSSSDPLELAVERTDPEVLLEIQSSSTDDLVGDRSPASAPSTEADPTSPQTGPSSSTDSSPSTPAETAAPGSTQQPGSTESPDGTQETTPAPGGTQETAPAPATTTPPVTTGLPATTTTTSGGSGQATPGSGGPVAYTYKTEQGDTGAFYSDRDCGWSTSVRGTNADGQNVARALWAFCDSVAYAPDTGNLWSDLTGVASSSYGLMPLGGNPTVDAVISPARSDGSGNPLVLNELLTRPEDSCQDSPDRPVPREWTRGMVTLPDNDPTTETVLVFYQNFCINFGDNDVEFGAGGVALVQWDANNPDGEVRREKLNDAWFLPGHTTDERGAGIYPSFTYGSGPIIHSEGGTTYLYSYFCGAGGDCTVARVSIDPDNATASARRSADTANWNYRTATGDWSPFPAAEAVGTCAPTVELDCGGFPAPLVVADADRANILSTPAAEPSVKQARGKWYLLYSAGLDNGQLAYRVADTPIGPFSEPRLVTLGSGHCTLDCRAAFWQPSADRDGLWAISYYDEHGLDGLVDQGGLDRRGRLMVTYVEPSAFR